MTLAAAGGMTAAYVGGQKKGIGGDSWVWVGSMATSGLVVLRDRDAQHDEVHAVRRGGAVGPELWLELDVISQREDDHDPPDFVGVHGASSKNLILFMIPMTGFVGHAVGAPEVALGA